MPFPDSFWNTLPLLITSVFTGIVALYGAVKAHQASQTGKENKIAIQTGVAKSMENSAAIEAVSKNIDGRMSELLEVTKTASKSEGVAVGKLEGMKEAQKDEALKNTPPPKT